MVLVTYSITCYDALFIEYDEDLFFYYDGRLKSNKSFFADTIQFSLNSPYDYLSSNTFSGTLSWAYSGSKSNNVYNFYLKNASLYTDADKTDFFFKAPVTEVPGKIPGTLGEIMNKAGELMTQEITQVILIVIMITAGLTVLLIGLRKGLKVLINGFRH